MSPIRHLATSASFRAPGRRRRSLRRQPTQILVLTTLPAELDEDDVAILPAGGEPYSIHALPIRRTLWPFPNPTNREGILWGMGLKDPLA